MKIIIEIDKPTDPLEYEFYLREAVTKVVDGEVDFLIKNETGQTIGSVMVC